MLNKFENTDFTYTKGYNECLFPYLHPIALSV